MIDIGQLRSRYRKTVRRDQDAASKVIIAFHHRRIAGDFIGRDQNQARDIHQRAQMIERTASGIGEQQIARRIIECLGQHHFVIGIRLDQLYRRIAFDQGSEFGQQFDQPRQFCRIATFKIRLIDQDRRGKAGQVNGRGCGD